MIIYLPPDSRIQGLRGAKPLEDPRRRGSPISLGIVILMQALVYMCWSTKRLILPKREAGNGGEEKREAWK